MRTRPWTQIKEIIDVDDVDDFDMAALSATPYLCGTSTGDGRIYIDQYALYSFLEVEDEVVGGSGLSQELINIVRPYLDKNLAHEFHFFAKWYGRANDANL